MFIFYLHRRCRLLQPRQWSRYYSRISSSAASVDPHKFAHSAPYPIRTHNCGSLSARDVGRTVVLSGWLLSQRHVNKSLSFFNLKDSFGITQIALFREKDPAGDLSALSDVPVESSVLIEGDVHMRPQKKPAYPTGEIEVHVRNFILLNPADRDLPFLSSDTNNLANEDLRARYRYLDLRRSALSDNLRKRSQVARIVRNLLQDQDFIEVETPILLKSSPEGAREFLVPTRTSGLESGTLDKDPLFYALPQSPQQAKQLLICSGGIDKYFQFARCFRDEDGRKDRQPEFTQIDLEMAFVSWGSPNTIDAGHHRTWQIGGNQVRDVVESFLKKIWHEVAGYTLPPRFQVMTYYDAMTRFGSDKPDTRFGLEVTQAIYRLSFSILIAKDQTASEYKQPFPLTTCAGLDNLGETTECLIVRAGDKEFISAARESHGQGHPAAESIYITENNAPTWLLKSKTLELSSRSNDAVQDPEINKTLNLRIGDYVWLARRPRRLEGGSTSLGRLRVHLAETAQSRGDYAPTKDPHFLWVTEFPLFTRADKDKEFLAQGRWSSTHHPFTAPMWQDIEAMYQGRIETVRGQHYDLVLNGVEIGGGSVRVHDANMQEYIFSRILQLSETEKSAFGHLMHALRCGAPPHGGIALGFDRMMAILCETPSIRDVIAFPKTSGGVDLTFKSPAPVSKQVLDQYGIQPRTR